MTYLSRLRGDQLQLLQLVTRVGRIARFPETGRTAMFNIMTHPFRMLAVVSSVLVGSEMLVFALAGAL